MRAFNTDLDLIESEFPRLELPAQHGRDHTICNTESDLSVLRSAPR